MNQQRYGWGVHSPLLRVFTVALLALASGCAKPEPPRVHPRAIRVASVSPTQLGLEVELEVHNPNEFALWVRRAQGTLMVGNGVEVGKGVATLDGSVPPKASSVVPATFRLNWTNIQALVPLALSTSSVPYEFRGTATFGSARLNLDLPLSLQGELTRAQMLQAGLNGISTLPALGGIPTVQSPALP